jgi:hypothetical protein
MPGSERRASSLVLVMALVSLTKSTSVAAQEVQHEHMQMTMESGWQFMQDGIVFAEFNHQGGARGGDEFVAPNWWMGIATRNSGRGRFTFNAMFSLDPATVGRDGYREIFQAGEALDGKPLIDRQHPHDLFMQLAASWRVPLGDTSALTVVGAPSGEPALGPIAFMHRASAVDNPTAPLGHHLQDSTHISFGVVTAAVDFGRWTVEGSVFNGREPDDNRWDFDFGPLDSVSARLWFRPTSEWALQVSTGHLTQPEELEPGNIERTTASVSWTRTGGANVAGITAGYGRNDTDHGARNAFLLEGARHWGANTIYSRLEVLQVETALLLTGQIPQGEGADVKDVVTAFTVGGVRDVLRVGGWEGGVGGDVTFYGVPESLRSPYGHPVSFHLFFRLRPPASPMGHMWNMEMARPMSPSHDMQ